MVQFFIKVSPVPIKKVRDKYKKTLKKIRSFAAVNAKQAVFLDRWVQRNFITEGRKVGGWAPFKHGGRPRSKKGRKVGLAQSIDSRKHVDASAKLLRDTTRLQRSFLPFHSARNAGIGSKLPYSESHDRGNEDINLPQRRILPEHTDEDVVDGLKLIYDKHVAKEINKNWEGIT